ncbi:site-specific integrase [Prevotella sp. tf2-5]|uniref:tyrosine-type recombinase/integrase n=1 Tax=Prevotella sp. tf2-5 TaxID=1761889 RepID=UPI0008EACD41|nr:site-specific integrase [Prevotella sp. tf2-5]SFO61660.1 Site-specific recombinase XerD [Prevotella sp. tf2-5]
MAKKNYVKTSRESAIDEIVGWKQPVFHQKSECYVSLVAFDPSRGEFRTKKFMLGHVKGKRDQRKYGEDLIRRLTEKLMRGWNPWVEEMRPTEYSSFLEVCDKYRDYLMKLLREDNLRAETYASYTSRLRMLLEWREEKNVNVFYTYQFDRYVISDFLDYVLVERNDTIRTRNNYLTWIKSFCHYLTERGYVPRDPSESFAGIKIRGGRKDRSVIPDGVLAALRDYLLKKNKHYLLACYILHYMFVRPHEMSYIRIGDISVKRKTLELHGNSTKNRCDATVTIPDHVMRLMIENEIFRHPGNYYLFSDDFVPGEKYRSEKAFRDYWSSRIRKDLGLPPQYKFYSLKDTGITNMLKANTDILSVRDQARHSSILITDIYTPKDIQEANDLLVNYHGVL